MKIGRTFLRSYAFIVKIQGAKNYGFSRCSLRVRGKSGVLILERGASKDDHDLASWAARGDVRSIEIRLMNRNGETERSLIVEQGSLKSYTIRLDNSLDELLTERVVVKFYSIALKSEEKNPEPVAVAAPVDAAS